MQMSLFKNKNNTSDSMNLVVHDKEEKQKYLLDEIKNKVILGDAFKMKFLTWFLLIHLISCNCQKKS